MTSRRAFLWLCVLPLAILLIAACALFLVGHPDAAWIVGMPGTAAWSLVVLAYVVCFDSRTRWPRASGWARLRRVLTLAR